MPLLGGGKDARAPLHEFGQGVGAQAVAQHDDTDQHGQATCGSDREGLQGRTAG